LARNECQRPGIEHARLVRHEHDRRRDRRQALRIGGGKGLGRREWLDVTFLGSWHLRCLATVPAGMAAAAGGVREHEILRTGQAPAPYQRGD
jgi:hypothetical protein